MNRATYEKGPRHWIGSLIYLYSVLFIGAAVGLAISLYLAAPAFLWVFYGAPYQPLTSGFGWLRYALNMAIFGGSVLWISEFIPWLWNKHKAHREKAE